eukprot:TRINITY_DN3401_c0_g1_i3.p1 TRINITY_DN3401_c0_g1~~TRINITY_DN3401_c0_g1_i3.p1  ORF type:complete len:218 (+),score=40.16 TRINITY_DN3401_c0_g1_i3:94-747(+)
MCIRDRISQVLAMAKRPRWQRDQDAATCSGCRKAFSLLRRRHHCRGCGLVFCDSCASGRQAIAAMGYAHEVRVCLVCSQGLNDKLNQTAPQDNPYLEWVRARCVEVQSPASPTTRTSREQSFEFSTLHGDWMKASSTSMATSVDSAVAAICIKAAEQGHFSSLTDNRTTFTCSETFSETEDSNLRDVLQACEDLQKQTRSKHVAPASGLWHGTSQVH